VETKYLGGGGILRRKIHISNMYIYHVKVKSSISPLPYWASISFLLEYLGGSSILRRRIHISNTYIYHVKTKSSTLPVPYWASISFLLKYLWSCL